MPNSVLLVSERFSCCISSQILDDNLDTVQTTVDGVTTFQERDKGLLSSEKVTDLYTNTVKYG